ncbi:MAG: response regulator transcription factor [Bacteroidota bacterium]
MLAEDHHSARQAYAGVINMEKNFEVIGQAENGKALFDLMENQEPDIVILDLDMPVMDGRTALVKLQNEHPRVKVIILSLHNEKIMVCDALLKGASGYLSKNCTIDDIFETINRVYTHGFFFNGSVSRQVIVDTFKKDKALLANMLTGREVEILKLFCEGFQLKEIADKLYISIDTVRYHMKHIHKKTEIDSTQKLVKFAIRNAFTNLD